MEINLQQIREYNLCPMIYKFRYIMKIERENEAYHVEQRFDNAIRKSIMFFYYQILNSKMPSQEQLLQKFGSLFYKDMTAEDILVSSTLDNNQNAMSAQGVKVLTSFYEREWRKKFTPIGVDMDVRIPMGNHFLMLTIDLIREMQYEERKLIEVVRFTTTHKRIDAFYINHYVPLTAYSYAFRKLFGTTENRLILQHMRTGKEIFTIRKEPELKRLEAIVKGTTEGISRKEFYPVHNMQQCGGCPYKDVCNKYKF